jgi:hypothetical protein
MWVLVETLVVWDVVYFSMEMTIQGGISGWIDG